MKHRAQRPSNERGAALVLIVVAMFVLILMAGMALDVGHMMLNKSRLQNGVDAAALSAAKTLNDTGSTALATAAALQALGLDANTTGNGELANTYDGNNMQVTVQYSSGLQPFTAGSTTGPYVRVIATGFTFPALLVRVAGVTTLGASASAVAGPSPTINTACNIAPMMVCGNPSPLASYWGYQIDSPQVLKSASPGDGNIGPGNFQLIQLGGTGDAIVRDNLAGSYQACAVNGDSVQTETGNGTGPVAQGLNTRFGIYSGPMQGTEAQYPPDTVTVDSNPALTVDANDNVWYGTTELTASNINSTSGVFTYNDYTAEEAAGPYQFAPASDGPGDYGVPGRRVLTVPVGDCTGTANGSTTVPVLGFACFFLLQPATHSGNTDYVVGQFEGNCQVNGNPGPNPGSGPGPYVIELYRDTGSPDS